MTKLAVSPPARWGGRAACKTADRSVFEPYRDPMFPSEEAQEYCRRCEVRPECLLWALMNDERGIWGGMSTHQRRTLLRTAERKKCPGCGARSVMMVGEDQLCLACGVSWRAKKRRAE